VIDNFAVLSFAGSVFRAITLALVAVSVLAALPLATVRVGRRLLETASRVGEDARGARQRVWGAAVAESLDAIRRAIPADGEYLLVDGGEEPQGATYWVRFELAPRRARFAGRLSEMTAPLRPPSLPAGPRWVVIAFPDGPAALLDRDDFLRRFLRHREPQSGPR
jgi:hypothetical protein